MQSAPISIPIPTSPPGLVSPPGYYPPGYYDPYNNYDPYQVSPIAIEPSREGQLFVHWCSVKELSDLLTDSMDSDN